MIRTLKRLIKGGKQKASKKMTRGGIRLKKGGRVSLPMNYFHKQTPNRIIVIGGKKGRKSKSKGKGGKRIRLSKRKV
jgi:hypothetical protein